MYQTSEKSTVSIAQFSAQWEGRTIDGFPLVRFLGGGESSAVFLTSHNAGPAAIKLLPADPQRAEAQLSRWREAQKLSHPNLIRIFSTGRCELDEMPLLYIVMERAEEDLAQVLPDRSLTAVEAREMLEPALKALGYIHGQGLVHAHIKPSNIMAVEDRLKISADGICRAGESATGPYAPPEAVASAAGDVWSLGITLVQVLTQHLPSNGIVPAVLPEPFLGIALGCLDRTPADRSSIPQILNLLTDAKAPATPRARRNTPIAVAVLIALVVIAVVGVVVMHSDTSAPAPVKPTEAIKTPEPQTPTPAPKQEPKQTAKADKQSEPTPTPTPEPDQPAEPPSNAPVTGILEKPLPDITDQARNTIRGKVKLTVRVEVAPSGAVTDAKLDSPGASKYFGDRALEAVRQWKFEPVSVNGSEVGQRWRVRFEFVRNGTKVQPQRVSP